MSLGNKLSLFSLLLIPVLFMGCNRDEIQAEKSIEGNWEIVSIATNYGSFDVNSFAATDRVEESGTLGSMNFTEQTVDLNFTRNDTSYTGTEQWSLAYEKVNSGFIRVPQFTLTIENQFVFDVLFEDGTKNAEKKATRMTFYEIISGPSNRHVEMVLEKR